VLRVVKAITEVSKPGGHGKAASMPGFFITRMVSH